MCTAPRVEIAVFCLEAGLSNLGQKESMEQHLERCDDWRRSWIHDDTQRKVKKK